MTAADQAAQLSAEFAAARKLLKKCKSCGWVPTMHYEPGVTSVKCPCGKQECVEGWNPITLANYWNTLRA